MTRSDVAPFPWTEVATRRDLEPVSRQVRGELRERIGTQKWTLLAGYLVGTATIAGVVLAAAWLG
jgi:hypothetical protein